MINTWATLKKENLNRAQLYADRIDMIEHMAVSFRPKHVAEVGVAIGDFSEVLIKSFSPLIFDAYDLFLLHTADFVFGRKSAEIFLSDNHKDYYFNKISKLSPSTIFNIYEGDSSSNLSKTNIKYDLIYLDGDHTYDGVVKDTEAALQKISTNGILVFNDYIIHDKFHNLDYGIVQVVNNLCASTNWKVIGYALNHGLFCDIALQRSI